MAGWLDWANLLIRWAHLVAGIAWIGSSFYFVWLDSHLTAPVKDKQGVEGELWMVHSGGFYQVEKRLIGPGDMPAVLHWFKWEAALTWASGVVLLAVVYYLTGGVYLVDPAINSITPGQATLLSIGLLASAWIVYDGIWSSALGRAGWPAAALSLVILGVAMFAMSRVLSGRAAFIHVGAMLGTIMVANVWLRILPAQQKMIDATKEGRQPDFALGKAAKRRSMHNSYLTLPVLFIMLSNHFPQTYSGPANWIKLALLIVAGAAARHVMIARPKGPALAASVAAFAGVVLLAGGARGTGAGGQRGRGAGEGVTFAQARGVINARCIQCHSAAATDDVFTVAPNGVTFDLPADIVRYAERIHERVVVQQTMPMANKTGMTEAERALIGQWISAGAHIQ